MALHGCCFIPISPTAMCLPPLASVFAANWALPHTVLPIPSAMEPGANLAWGKASQLPCRAPAQSSTCRQGPRLGKCGGPQLPPEPPGPSGGSRLGAGGDITWEWSELCVMPPVFSTDEAWTEVTDTLTVAAIRFEMLSTAHRSQVGEQFVQSGVR